MSAALAKALIDEGVQHYDAGGAIGSVFNAITGQTNFSAAAPDYVGNMNTTFQNDMAVQGQQNALAKQLLDQSQGNGPNPAQALYQQNQNAAAQQAAGLIASQKGVNPAVAARMAAQQQGQQMQQGAAGAAAQQATQQLNAQTQLEQQQSNIANENQNLYKTSEEGQTGANTTNANVAMANAASEKDSIGGALGGAGKALSSIGSVFGFATGGAIPDHLSRVAEIHHGDFMKKARDFRAGGPVPGKAKVPGNSVRNDVVPAMLSPGEEVLPRSVTQAQDAPAKASEFVRHLQEQKKTRDSKEGYPGPARKQMALKDRVERLEKMFSGGQI